MHGEVLYMFLFVKLNFPMSARYLSIKAYIVHQECRKAKVQTYRAAGCLTETEAIEWVDGHMRTVFQNAVVDFITLQVR